MTTQSTSASRFDRDASAASVVSRDRHLLTLNRVSWGAVAAGVMVALVTQLILNMIGIGLGAASFQPNSETGTSGGSLSIVAGIWWAVAGILAAFAGGYTAGRLSGLTQPIIGGWHGLTAWAMTTLLVFYLLSTGVGAVIGGAFRTLGTAAGAAAPAIATTVAPVLRGGDPLATVDEAIRKTTSGSDPAALREAAASAVRASLSADAKERDTSRDRAVQALARAQGTSPEEARAQYDGYEQQYRATVDRTKQQATEAADAGAKALSRGALIGALALVLGALAAWFGGRVGRSLRPIGAP